MLLPAQVGLSIGLLRVCTDYCKRVVSFLIDQAVGVSYGHSGHYFLITNSSVLNLLFAGSAFTETLFCYLLRAVN